MTSVHLIMRRRRGGACIDRAAGTIISFRWSTLLLDVLVVSESLPTKGEMERSLTRCRLYRVTNDAGPRVPAVKNASYGRRAKIMNGIKGLKT